MDNEIWKDINGYEGLYQISNYGNVKSLEKLIGHRYNGMFRKIPERFMSICDNGNGYKCVYLVKDKKRNMKYIHRLVAEHFLEKIDNKNYINHKDYNIENNYYKNLEWCTQKENVSYSSNNMRHPNRADTTSKTGYKYIYNRNGRFRVSIKNFCKEKLFNNIDDAVIYRNSIINSNKEYFYSGV